MLALARELNENEKVKLVLKVSGGAIGEILMNKKAEELCCPYCGSMGFVKNGENKETQRFKCKSCTKSFISVTNTPIYYSRKNLNVWIQYVELMIKGYSLRETIEVVPLSLQTAFFWLHKILDTLREHLKTKELSGNIESDETYFRLSRPNF